jgi:hypothetical protein
MWGYVHVAYLIGWGNRLGTIYTWSRSLYLSKNRGHRIISFESAGYEIAGQRTISRAVRPRPYRSALASSDSSDSAAGRKQALSEDTAATDVASPISQRQETSTEPDPGHSGSRTAQDGR